MAVSEIPPPGERLLGGKIRLIRRIGRGGMGDVWAARNEATQAEVAVKTLQRAQRKTDHDERFRREARLAATVSHRNVIRIFDLIEADGTLALVMELLRGVTLETCMRVRGVVSSLQAVAVIAPILSGLHHVHQRGIVHRDMKPANVFFAVEPDGHVIPKIIDFGIAKLPAAGAALTLEGSVLGTPHYMSPEQIRGHELDGRSDMFSVAVVLYEMLTGERAFHRDSAAASLAAVLEHEVDPDPQIDPRLWLVLARALAKRPYERYANCAEFAEALRSAVLATDEDFQQALQELLPRVPTLPPPTLGDLPGASIFESGVPRRPQRRGLGLAAVGLAGVTSVLIGAIALTGRSAGHPVEPASITSVERSEPPVHASTSAVPSVESRPSASAESVDPAASAATAAAALASGNAKSPSAKSAPPRPASRAAGSSSVRPASTAKKPVATSPGF